MTQPSGTMKHPEQPKPIRTWVSSQGVNLNILITKATATKYAAEQKGGK